MTDYYLESDGLLKKSTIADDLKMAEQTNIPSAILNSEQGLSGLEVEQRKKAGLINKTKDFTERKISHIVMKNVFSLFNVLHIAIAASLLYVGSYKNTLFLGVVFCNMIIGIVQEIRAKKILDKLNSIQQDTLAVINQSIEHDWATFYELPSYSNKKVQNKFGETKDTKSVKVVEEIENGFNSF